MSTQMTEDWRARGIIDLDIHPALRDGTNSLLPYVSAAWRDRLALHNMSFTKLTGPRYINPNPTNRLDATPPGGGPPASDPEFVVSHHLDPAGIGCALLLCFQAGALNAWADGREAAEWATAYNRYFAENWLGVDSRFRLGMVVAPHDPERAAAEVRRMGPNPGVAGVWLPLLNMLLGNRYYYPIYAAAAELGLPILVHGGGADGSFQGAAPLAVASPSTFAERYASLAAGGIYSSNLCSLIFEGVFETFPTLKVVFIETSGWTWVGPAMWKMDRSWMGLRRQVPWLKEPPSHYVLEHCRFTSEPVDEPEPRMWLLQAAQMMHAERTLCYSSDYPHWDADAPDFVFKDFPESLRQRIFVENALETFGSRMSLGQTRTAV